MTQVHNRLLDEFAKLATDAAGLAHSARLEVETVMRTQLERLVSEMNVVPREEFDALKDMAIAARNETEALRQELTDLQKSVEGLKRQAKPKPASGQRQNRTQARKPKKELE